MTILGLFSILKDRWLIIPSWNEPKIDQRDVKEKVRVIKSEISIIAKKVKSANSEEAQVLYDYLARLKKKIMSDRKDGLARDGEFAVENLVFKELRRSGAIEKIIDLGSDIYYKIYSE